MTADHTTPEPMLTEHDIPWGRGGMAVGIIVDLADAGTYRELLSAALARLHRSALTNSLQKRRIAALRDELRTARSKRVS